MSGGLDSTVTAAMLHDEGYEVIGITMKTWDYATSDARQVAVDMGFHHFIIDIREEFGESVIDYFVDEYLSGRTPNPCVMCNTHIKWSALLKRADALDCEFIATGHYAQTRQENNRWVISKGLDRSKDQSYVLWGLSQENLARNMFPVGGFHKTEIRQMALDMGYESLAKKAESYEICFVPDNDYRGFLKRNVDGLEQRVAGGNFVNIKGEVIGTHDGYPFYTIGQRRGLGKAFGKPTYVLEINPQTNTVTLGDEEHLARRAMIVKGYNGVKYDTIPTEGLDTITKIRYNDAGMNAAAYGLDDGRVKVQFTHAVNAITPGQSAVMYDGDDVVGGGHIEIPIFEN
ncbi:UNVERIFIED_CONTAM: hypothetical protein GTU68_002433 [Idotea baltica]|nr:hypothetical protein [Idotea baltica]